jgi:hypothetical protein
MSDATLLMLAIGPVSVMVKADRQSKGISEGQLARKWEMLRSASTTRNEARRRVTVDVAVDCGPTLRVECGRTSS